MTVCVYAIGAVLYLAYKCFRLESSVIRSNVQVRFFAALFNSLLWFIYLPLELLQGRLFLKQHDYDSTVYKKAVKVQVAGAIWEAKAKFPDMSSQEVEELRERLLEDIGTLDDALNDCIYFSKSITEYQLAGLIAYAFSQSTADQQILIEKYEKVTPAEFVKSCISNIPTLTDQIKEDLKFLDVDENYTSITYKPRSSFESLLGFQTNDSGLTYYGVEIKSKDTIPFFCIIYYDGMKLRAFVPPHNLYNKDTSQPFGIDEKADVLFLEDVFDEECLKSKMYRRYAERINVETIEEQIDVTVNYLPLESQNPQYGWQDIKK
jgi:hypothetical protein